MSSRCFEVLPHTADKRIKAYGDSLVELFKNAALGMFSLMARLEDYTPSEAREFGVEAIGLESLLRDWLAELLYVFEVDRILFVNFEIHS
ncbi:MAG: archease, partial [Armatimonadetes bacterium]|nr:archease [Armatimonadota bacterium]